MKYILFLTILCCVGCAGTLQEYQGKGGPFRAYKKDGSSSVDVLLISVRDSGYIVALHSDTGRNELKKAFFLHRDSVKQLMHLELTGFGFKGGIIGFVAGALVGGTYGYLTYEPSFPFGYEFRPYATFGWALLSGLAGGFIGGIVTAPQSKFDLRDPHDREQLIYLCKYCGHEPPEILNMK